MKMCLSWLVVVVRAMVSVVFLCHPVCICYSCGDLLATTLVCCPLISFAAFLASIRCRGCTLLVSFGILLLFC